jgi:hypothetical protein
MGAVERRGRAPVSTVLLLFLPSLELEREREGQKKKLLLFSISACHPFAGRGHAQTPSLERGREREGQQQCRKHSQFLRVSL